MARTLITANAILDMRDQDFNLGAGLADVPFEDSDAALGNATPCTGRELLIVKNNDVGAQTITIDGAALSDGRDGAITDYSLAADDIAVFKGYPQSVYRQSDGMIHINTSDDNVQLAVVRV